MIFCEFLHYLKAEIYQNTKFRGPKIAKMAFFELSHSAKLFSRKIWVTEKSWNIHIVCDSQCQNCTIACPGLYYMCFCAKSSFCTGCSIWKMCDFLWSTDLGSLIGITQFGKFRFFAPQILREINFGHFEAPKTAILSIRAALNVELLGFLTFQSVKFP